MKPHPLPRGARTNAGTSPHDTPVFLTNSPLRCTESASAPSVAGRQKAGRRAAAPVPCTGPVPRPTPPSPPLKFSFGARTHFMDLLLLSPKHFSSPLDAPCQVFASDGIDMQPHPALLHLCAHPTPFFPTKPCQPAPPIFISSAPWRSGAGATARPPRVLCCSLPPIHWRPPTGRSNCSPFHARPPLATPALSSI